MTPVMKTATILPWIASLYMTLRNFLERIIANVNNPWLIR